MTVPSFLKLLWRAIRDTLWALVLVFVFRGILMHYGLRVRYDYAIHFTGGLAMAYLLYRSIGIFSAYLGELSLPTRLLLAYTTSCTVVLFWELGEFASDLFLRTRIQFSVSETLYDLMAGASGALVTVVLIAIISWIRGKPRSS